jgi:hypothetical protein
VRRRVEEEAALQKLAGEKLAQHQQREPERDRPRRQRLRPARGRDDHLRRDRDPARDLQMPQRDPPALQHALRIVSAVFLVVLVLVMHVPSPREGEGKELVGGVVGEDEEDVGDGGETLVEVLKEPNEESGSRCEVRGKRILHSNFEPRTSNLLRNSA